MFAFALILVIPFLATGCTDFHGDYGYEIINEYEIWRDSIGVHITDPYGTVSSEMFVEEFGVYEQYIYGDSYSYNSSSPFKGFFIIDTGNHSAQYYASRSQLENALEVLGLNQIELHDPYDFLRHRWVRRVLYFLLFVVILTPFMGLMYRRQKIRRRV